MKIRKEFKNEVDAKITEADYITRKIVEKAVIWIVVLTIIFGAVGVGFKYVKTNADRKIFKQSTIYNEGVLDDLAKYKYEYDTAEDDVTRDAIASLVRNRFANYDITKIENRDLVKFLKECGL